MSTNFYETAREQACREIAAIDSQVQGLAHRKGQLVKLIELLSELESEPQQGSVADDLAAIPTPHQPVAESIGPEAPTLAAHLEKLHEYEQSQARIGAETTGDIATLEVPSFSHEQIAERAYGFWIDHGCAHGHHEEDWLRAEAELRG